MIFRDLKYIIKRIIIGVGIALALMFIKGNFLMVANAQTVSYDVPLVNASVSSSGYGSTSGMPPLRQSYGNYMSTIFANSGNYIMTSGNSYYIYYVVDIVAQDFSVTNGQIDFYFLTSNNTVIHGYPDREEYQYLYHTGTNTYTLVYMFGLDVTVNIVNTTFQFNYSSSYNADFLRSGIDKATLTVVLPDNGSSGGGSSGGSTIVDFQPVIVNQIQNTQSLINNQNQNTSTIINNQNQNTQDIIDNQDSNTASIQETINDNLQTCVEAHSVYPTFVGVGLSIGSGYNGVTLNSNNSGGVVDVSRYVGKNVTITFDNLDTSHNARNNYCFTSQPATSTRQTCLSYHISGSNNSSATYSDITVPQGAKYLYLVGYNNYVDNTWVSHSTVHFYRACFNKLDDTNSSINNINNTLTDDNVDNSIGSANNFFTNFNVNSHGISGIITSPLRLLQTFTTATCSPLTFQLPFIHNIVTLPCMKPIIQNYFGLFFSLYQLITTGLISYHVLINIYSKIRDLQDPNKDRIEVLNL